MVSMNCQLHYTRSCMHSSSRLHVHPFSLGSQGAVAHSILWELMGGQPGYPILVLLLSLSFAQAGDQITQTSVSLPYMLPWTYIFLDFLLTVFMGVDPPSSDESVNSVLAVVLFPDSPESDESDEESSLVSVLTAICLAKVWVCIQYHTYW